MVKHDEQLLIFAVLWLVQRMVEEEEWEKMSHGVEVVAAAVLFLFGEDSESQEFHPPCASDVSLLLLIHYSLLLNTVMILRQKNCNKMMRFVTCIIASSGMVYLGHRGDDPISINSQVIIDTLK